MIYVPCFFVLILFSFYFRFYFPFIFVFVFLLFSFYFRFIVTTSSPIIQLNFGPISNDSAV